MVSNSAICNLNNFGSLLILQKTAGGAKPKRGLNPYMIWLNENRQNLKKQHGDLSPKELAKKAGEEWRALADKSVSFYPTKMYIYVENFSV